MNLRAFLSFLPLILLTLIFTVGRAVLASRHLDVPAEPAGLWRVLYPLFTATWVYLDRRTRQLKLPFEFNAFVFFASPIALPYYLYKTRGRQGLLVTVLIFALLLLPSLVAQVFHPMAVRWQGT